MRLVPKRTAAEATEVTQCDRELEEWYESLPEELRYFKSTTPREQNVRNDGEVINLHRALLTGLYLTTTSALHRPQMMPAMPNLVIAPELKELSKRRVREASGAITDIFRDLYNRDLIRYLPNTGVTILLPAIIVHLLDIKSPDSATRQLSIRRFQFCMQALQKLRDVYASADFAFSFLDAAIRKADVPVHESNQLQSMGVGVPRDASAPSPVAMMNKQRALSKTLTPPPDLPTMQQIRAARGSFSSQSTMAEGTNFVNPQATTLPDGRRNSYAALTPPSSDRIPYFGESNSGAGAAITLGDVGEMHHSPPMSIDDATMGLGSSAGYVEANKLMEQFGNLDHMVDEEAMMNDFDQLINLEGSGGNTEQLFTDTLAEATTGLEGDIKQDPAAMDYGSISIPNMDADMAGDDSQGLSADAIAKLSAAMQEATEAVPPMTEKAMDNEMEKVGVAVVECQA